MIHDDTLQVVFCKVFFLNEYIYLKELGMLYLYYILLGVKNTWNQKEENG